MVAKLPLPVARVVLLSIFHGLAIISTTFRLVFRIRTYRFWWDDAWAFVSLMCDIILFVPVLVQSYTRSSNHARVAVYWIQLGSFNGELWAARMSLIVAIIRITPPMIRMRQVALVTAILFALMGITTLVQAIWLCARDTSWYYTTAFCYVGHAVAITQLCMDVVSDALLVVIPLRLLWRSKIPRDQRILIFVLFSASVWITLVSIARNIMVFNETVGGIAEGIAGHVEAAVSLIACNSLVIGTYAYRTLTKGRDIESMVDYSGLVVRAFGSSSQEEPK